jgi:hypothetical protein
MEAVVNGSASCNVAQLVGREDGTPIVPVYEWHDHLESHGTALPAIKKYYHFR